jgi:hypothetical protein
MLGTTSVEVATVDAVTVDAPTLLCWRLRGRWWVDLVVGSSR